MFLMRSAILMGTRLPSPKEVAFAIVGGGFGITSAVSSNFSKSPYVRPRFAGCAPLPLPLLATWLTTGGGSTRIVIVCGLQTPLLHPEAAGFLLAVKKTRLCRMLTTAVAAPG